MVNINELVANLRADSGAIVIMHPDTPVSVQTFYKLNFPDQVKITDRVEPGVIAFLPTITLDTLLAEMMGRSSESTAERLTRVMNEVHCKYGAEVMVRGKKTLIRVRSEHAGEMHCLFHREDIRHDAVADQGNGFQVWQVWRNRSTHTDPDCEAVCSIEARLENRGVDQRRTPDHFVMGHPVGLQHQTFIDVPQGYLQIHPSASDVLHHEESPDFVWFTNVGKNDRDAFARLQQGNGEVLMGKPKGTQQYTVEKLQSLGLTGLYRTNKNQQL